MEYIFIPAGMIVVAIIIALLIFFKRRTGTELISNSNEVISLSKHEDSHIQQIIDSGLIPVEKLQSLIAAEEKSLVEIKDKGLIARISALMPGSTQIALQGIGNVAVQNAVKNVGEVYRVVIPAGAKLTDSKSMLGAVRGIFHGDKGIQGHADLVKVDPNQIGKAGNMAAGVANVMNVASMVVGQYYMAEISLKLEEINNNISQVADFQKREFKSRILSLIERVGKISQFNVEIIENEELRIRKLQTLEDLEGICSELLQQMNLTIAEITESNSKSDFDNYKKTVCELGTLITYQEVLLTVFGKISDLTYLLNKGVASVENSYSLYESNKKRSMYIRNNLAEWHSNQTKSLDIDISQKRKSKEGFDAVLAAIPAIFDEKWKYTELADDFVQKITAQSQSGIALLPEPEAIYEKDVQVIIKQGRYYYLPEVKVEQEAH